MTALEVALSLGSTNPTARLVYLTLAAIADADGRVATTVHTLEHLTGLRPTVIATVLGDNAGRTPFIPAAVSLVDGVVTVALPTVLES